MISILSAELEKYLSNHTMDRHDIFREMEEYAEKSDFPIVGPQVGQLLYILTKLSKATKVLEVGSGFGYSALWFGLAMGSRGTVIATEYNEENINRAQDYLRRVDTLRSTIAFQNANGIDILVETRDKFDIIFNDANKEDYPKIFKLAHSRLKKNGLLISDNALWHGRITDIEPDEKTAGVIEYNKLIFASSEFFSSIIPIRDGISVSVKI